MAALADYLMDEFTSWDALELAGVRSDDEAVGELVAQLCDSDQARFHRQEAFRCWRLALPSSWDAYMASLAKNFRRRLRKLQQFVVDAERLVAHRVVDASQFDAAWQVLVDLHQRRRRSLGQPGCFASQRFTAFHQEVARRLLECGQLELVWFELDGRPLSVEYNLLGTTTTYTYQGGIEPELLHEQPGHLASMHTIKRAIADGHESYDFLRGDERYKAQWRAEPVPMHTFRVVPQRTGSQLREAAYQAVGNVKDWLKASWQLVRETTPGAYAS
jgi:CelD/BcsL family acetyltransferase involved in cellulose biosynthesis